MGTRGTGGEGGTAGLNSGTEVIIRSQWKGWEGEQRGGEAQGKRFAKPDARHVTLG